MSLMPLGIMPVLRACNTQINTLEPTISQYFLQKIGDIPLGPSDFVGCICLSTFQTSSTLNSFRSSLFISRVTPLSTASKLASKLEGWPELNIDEK